MQTLVEMSRAAVAAASTSEKKGRIIKAVLVLLPLGSFAGSMPRSASHLVLRGGHLGLPLATEAFCCFWRLTELGSTPLAV